MTWTDKMKEWGGGDFTFLGSDGECLIFVVVADPVLIKTQYKKKPQERIGCPVVTDDGFVLFITGKRVARKLSKFESRFKTDAFIVTRHGGEGDIDAKYDVKVFSDTTKAKQLFELAAKEYKPELLEQAITDAQNIVIS